MKNELQVFTSPEFGDLQTLEVDGKIYFPATRCAEILGYQLPRKAVLDHCKEDGVLKRNVIDRLGRNQEMKFIDEGNLYRLIGFSTKFFLRFDVKDSILIRDAKLIQMLLSIFATRSRLNDANSNSRSKIIIFSNNKSMSLRQRQTTMIWF